MSSLNPAQQTEPTINLSWNCTGKQRFVRTLANQWLSEFDEKCPYLDEGYVRKPRKLDWREKHEMQTILKMDKAEAADLAESLFTHVRLAEYERMRTRLLCILMAWEQLILEKKRFVNKGRYEGDLNPHQICTLFQIIWGLARPGLPDMEME